MALPNSYLKRREALHGDRLSAQQLAAMARIYMQQQSYSEALDFFEKAEDQNGLTEIKKKALERGDTFLLYRLQRFDRSKVSRSDWEQAAMAAKKRGIFSMAAFARSRLAELDYLAMAVPGETPLEEK